MQKFVVKKYPVSVFLEMTEELMIFSKVNHCHIALLPVNQPLAPFSDSLFMLIIFFCFLSPQVLGLKVSISPIPVPFFDPSLYLWSI